MPIDPSKSKFKNEPKDFTVIPEGMYTAEVVDAVLMENQTGYKGKIVDKIYFYLGILDSGEQHGVFIRYDVSTAFNDGYEGGSASKLYELACAVYGEKLNPDNEFDANTLIGGRLRIVVKHSTGKKGGTFANVKEVMKVDAVGKKLPELSDEERSKILSKVKKPEDSISDEDLDEIDSQISQEAPDVDLGADFEEVLKS